MIDNTHLNMINKKRFYASTPFLLALGLHIILFVLLIFRWQSNTFSEQAGVSAEIWTSLPQFNQPSNSPPPVTKAPKIEALPKSSTPTTTKADIVLKKNPSRPVVEKRAEISQQKSPPKALPKKEKVTQAPKTTSKALEKNSPHPIKKTLQTTHQTGAQHKPTKNVPSQASKASTLSRSDNLAQMDRLLKQSAGTAAAGQGSGQQGVSNDYAEKIKRHIKPHIIWGGARNALKSIVQVHCASNGRILNAQIIKSSGNANWDNAVLRAIYASNPLPVDNNGQAPSLLTITFQANE